MAEIIVGLIKYTFVTALAVEGVLILRALYQLAREKARVAQAAPAATEE